MYILRVPITSFCLYVFVFFSDFVVLSVDIVHVLLECFVPSTWLESPHIQPIPCLPSWRKTDFPVTYVSLIEFLSGSTTLYYRQRPYTSTKLSRLLPYYNIDFSRNQTSTLWNVRYDSFIWNRLPLPLVNLPKFPLSSYWCKRETFLLKLSSHLVRELSTFPSHLPFLLSLYSIPGLRCVIVNPLFPLILVYLYIHCVSFSGYLFNIQSSLDLIKRSKITDKTWCMW